MPERGRPRPGKAKGKENRHRQNATSPARGQGWLPRGIRFLRVPKEALDRISDNSGADEAPGLIAVYLGLVRIADHLDSSTFEKPLGYVAKLAMVHKRTVQRHLPRLEALGLVTVERQQIPDTKARDVHKFTLTTFCHDLTTDSHDLVTGIPPLPVTCTRNQETAKPSVPGAKGTRTSPGKRSGYIPSL